MHQRLLMIWFRKVGEAEGQTAHSLSSGLMVQVEFIFVALF